MPAKKVFLRLFLVLVILSGTTAGVVLVRQRLQLNKQAAVPRGRGEITLSPTSGNFKVGDKIPVKVYFKTSGISISGITARLTYPYNGTTSELTVSDIKVNPQFATSGSWSCPTASTTNEAGNVYVDVACANISAAGFSTSTNTLLASFNINIGKVPVNNPTIIRFDTSQSIMTQKSTGQDILKIPSGDGSIGTYTIEGQVTPVVSATPTVKPSATPIPPTATPTVKPSATPIPPTATPTIKPTATPKPSATVKPTNQPTATPSEAPQLPDAGISYPTIIMMGLGVVLLGAAILLAL